MQITIKGEAKEIAALVLAVQERQWQMDKLTFSYRDITCMARHMKALFEQASLEQKAQFGEPCENCSFENECRGDWLSVAKKIIKHTDVRFQFIRSC